MSSSGRLGLLLLCIPWAAALPPSAEPIQTVPASRADIRNALAEQNEHPEHPDTNPRRNLTSIILDRDPTLQRGHHNYCDKMYLSRAVVVAAGRHDTTWLQNLGITFFQYQFRNPDAPYYYENLANEAGAYLQFIVDHWDCLPSATVFLHGHREASWHSEDSALAVQQLRWDDVTFSSINRMPTKYWEWKMADHPETPWLEPDPNVNMGRTNTVVATGQNAYNGSYPADEVYRGKAYDPFDMHVWLLHGAALRAYDKFFGMHGLGPCPKSIKFICCAQFAVSKERIQGRPLEFYKKALWYIANNDLPRTNQANHRYVVGDVFSMMYGMIFGEPAHHIPKPDCDIFFCPGSASSI